MPSKQSLPHYILHQCPTSCKYYTLQQLSGKKKDGSQKSCIYSSLYRTLSYKTKWLSLWASICFHGPHSGSSQTKILVEGSNELWEGPKTKTVCLLLSIWRAPITQNDPDTLQTILFSTARKWQGHCSGFSILNGCLDQTVVWFLLFIGTFKNFKIIIFTLENSPFLAHKMQPYA